MITQNNGISCDYLITGGLASPLDAPVRLAGLFIFPLEDQYPQAAMLCKGIGLDQLPEDICTRYAVERALEIVGTAARQVSQEATDAHPEISWSGILGFRNVLAHQYGAIDYRRLYTLLKEDVPELIVALENILALIENNRCIRTPSPRNPGTTAMFFRDDGYLRGRQ